MARGKANLRRVPLAAIVRYYRAKVGRGYEPVLNVGTRDGGSK